MSAPLTPDLSDASRCVSVHWSLPVQCVLPRAHHENWHEAWHPETGNRMRYRHTIGATEELHHGGWHDLRIPAPKPSAEAEVARLQALVAEMHAAAVGETRPPLLGLVEDVALTRDAYEAQQARADTLNRLALQHHARVTELETANLEAAERAQKVINDLRARVDEVERQYIFDTAELKKRIAELETDSATLAALEAHGVDGWEGYSDALEAGESA